MVQVKNVKDVQRLMVSLVALNRFVSRLGEHKLNLYKLLNNSDSFRWTEETQNALDELKTLITKLSVLALLELDKNLLPYIVAITQVISAALVVEWDQPRHVYKVQRPVY
jgi:hypothetical protein